MGWGGVGEAQREPDLGVPPQPEDPIAAPLGTWSQTSLPIPPIARMGAGHEPTFGAKPRPLGVSRAREGAGALLPPPTPPLSPAPAAPKPPIPPLTPPSAAPIPFPVPLCSPHPSEGSSVRTLWGRSCPPRGFYAPPIKLRQPPHPPTVSTICLSREEC